VTSTRRVLAPLALLFGTVGGVAAVTFGLAAALAPGSSVAEPTATLVPSFDTAVAPEAVGGRLSVEGDRTGIMTLDAATGIGGRYEVREGGGVLFQPPEGSGLQGVDGRIVFGRGSGEVTLIDYDGLSFYLEPGECTVTHGAVNQETELMAALIECPEIADVRGKGVVSIAGVIALPADVLRGRGDLPPTGGSIEVAGTSVEFDEAEIFISEPPEGYDRTQWSIFTDDFASGIHLEYDSKSGRYFLGALSVNEDYAVLSEPCPIASDELGRINEVTTTVRLELDCRDVDVPGGATGSVTGTVIADVIDGFVQVLPEG